ncbi:MAG TPA: rod-binding protein [Xanthobacteraceae bacterium]|nr:rod-binding protein [Xanthobacteraceae bacterium]
MTTATIPAAAAALGQTLGSLSDTQSAQAQAALKIKGNAKATSQQFEAMFLNTMFQQMYTGMDGDGPFGGSGALKIWRSMLTDQYATSFAKNGGIGIASHVYDALLKQQGIKPS